MIDASEPSQRLARIGLSPQLAAAARALAEAHPGCELLRVTEVQRESLLLHDGDAERAARLLPACRERLAWFDDALAVGDWVLAQRNVHGQCWVQARVPPANQLARRQHDGRDKAARVALVSNVDLALLVMGLDPDFNLRRLERYASLARMAGVAAVLVLTKRDLAGAALTAERLAQARAVLLPGYEAVAVDATGGEPRTALARWLRPAATLVLLGSSGAGKSTLTNALCEAAVAATGAARAGDGRGRHTTTSRRVHLAPSGACVIDTPGLRTLRLDADPGAIGQAFDDVATLAPRCRFRNCRHHDEPGCAVRDAVAAERLRNFHKLQREAERDQLSALQRKEQVALWKSRHREGRLRAAAKRG